ncbi:MAG: hypothetical protein AAFZ11_01180 [Pseudomonadota bacterium]
MGFSLNEIRDRLARHKFLVALIIVAVLGYNFGKDWAFRDNAADQVAAGEAS